MRYGKLLYICYICMGLVLLASPAYAVLLKLPIACTPGKNCFVQNYVDHDPGAGWTDFRCGHLTYNGHDGTDFRLPSLAEMEAGVGVLAAAPGVVKAVRNDMLDINMREVDAALLKGRECGNGVTLEHEDGWETQYCHLKKGSVVVQAGDTVKARQPLGQVGLSGQTEFPHLHLTLRHDGETIDPFTGRKMAVGCGLSGFSQWHPKTLEKLAYTVPGVIASGFTDEAPDSAGIMAGKHRLASIPEDAPALIFWTQIYGPRAGDVLRMILSREGKTVAQQAITLDKNKADYLMYIGAKKFTAGEHVGHFTLTRTTDKGSETILSEEVKTISIPTN